MRDYKKLYETLKDEYEIYQRFSEKHIQELYEKNIQMQKANDSLANIVEISKYINTFFSDENLISMINDMIIGILGVTYSTIFLIENDEIIIKASNISDMKVSLTSEEIEKINNEEEFIINSEKQLKEIGDKNVGIHSIMGMPILLRDKFIGYIIIEHKIYNFMNVSLKLFLRSISNQVAIAIENSYLYKELEKTTRTDPLMHIYNRKYFFEYMEKKLARNDNTKFAIVMIDIDDFKKVNDNFGHQFGDKVLINTGNVIKNWLGDGDVIARYGGEEIILYMTDFYDETSIHDKVEIIRRSIESSVVTMNDVSVCVTASFGIAYYPLNSKDLNNLIKLADDLLYEAKRTNKNKVISNYKERV